MYKIGHDEARAIDKPDVWCPEERLEMLRLCPGQLMHNVEYNEATCFTWRT